MYSLGTVMGVVHVFVFIVYILCYLYKHVMHPIFFVNNISLFIILLTGNHSQPQTVEEFAEQVFSAMNKVHSDVKHLSEVHIVIYEQQMAQKFIMAMQQCFQSHDSKAKGWFLEKLANYIPSAGK